MLTVVNSKWCECGYLSKRSFIFCFLSFSPKYYFIKIGKQDKRKGQASYMLWQLTGLWQPRRHLLSWVVEARKTHKQMEVEEGAGRHDQSEHISTVMLHTYVPHQRPFTDVIQKKLSLTTANEYIPNFSKEIQYLKLSSSFYK